MGEKSFPVYIVIGELFFMLEIIDVTKRYRNGKGIGNLNLRFEKGKINGLLGSNGSGKTTTFKLIAGLLKPDKGKILWGGKELGERAGDLVGYLPEERYYFRETTVFDILSLTARIYQVKNPNVRIELLLNDFGLKSEKYRNIADLSKGQRQLLQVGMVLLPDPEILLLDEGFDGLDIDRQELLISILEQLKKDKLIILSSHDQSLIERICERKYILKEGKSDERLY